MKYTIALILNYLILISLRPVSSSFRVESQSIRREMWLLPIQETIEFRCVSLSHHNILTARPLAPIIKLQYKTHYKNTGEECKDALQVFSSSGEFIATFGSWGSGAGQLKGVEVRVENKIAVFTIVSFCVLFWIRKKWVFRQWLFWMMDPSLSRIETTIVYRSSAELQYNEPIIIDCSIEYSRHPELFVYITCTLMFSRCCF